MHEIRVYGTVTFNVEMFVESFEGESTSDILERANSVYEGMDAREILHILCKDSEVDAELEEVNFTEIEF
jgi:hypothetical protein